MTFSPRTKRNFLRILPFGVIWLVAGWLFLSIEYWAVENTEEWAETAIRMDLRIFIFASLAVFLVGIILGFIEITFVSRLFRRQSFGKKMLYKLIFYAFVFSLVNLFTFPVAASFELHTGLFDGEVWSRYLAYLTSKTHYSTLLQMSASQFMALFYAEIGETVGFRPLLNFFTGKYHRPVEEERIFMFLDLRSSTTIAEQLGHITYFKFLRAFYEDTADAIIDHGGEVYQYVGDEIIVSWPMRSGMENAHCIRCFFSMRAQLQKRRQWYHDRFGVYPSFKAGMHCGPVTTGEIGVIRREIFFTSDVLNTASRIQGLCNTYGVDLLISSDLLEQLHLPSGLLAESMGESALRGKSESTVLYAIREAHTKPHT